MRETTNSKPKTPGQGGDDRMVGLVETMLKLHERSRTLTADSLRLAAQDRREPEGTVRMSRIDSAGVV
jgi:hypothetical protein